jgi:hypothetical protein
LPVDASLLRMRKFSLGCDHGTALPSYRYLFARGSPNAGARPHLDAVPRMACELRSRAIRTLPEHRGRELADASDLQRFGSSRDVLGVDPNIRTDAPTKADRIENVDIDALLIENI